MRLLALALLLVPAAAAPAVTDIVAAATPVPPNGSTSVTVVATGAGLTYSWTATGGSISGSGPSVTWTAPAAPGTYTVNVIVSDAGGSTSAAVQIPVPTGSYEWAGNTPPAGMPFARSTSFPGLLMTGRSTSYHFADTWYPSWGQDDALYSPWQDGSLLTDPYNGLSTAAWAQPAETGWARITGDSPLNLVFTNAGVLKADRSPYGGRYPAGSLHHNGIWYYGSYLTTNEGGSSDPTVTTADGEFNWGVLGPFMGFHISSDNGQTWQMSPWTPTNTIFGEPAQVGGKVKIGVPHFVDFGKNMQHSPDGKAYMVAHGAVDPDPLPRPANLSWINGDQIYLLRCTPSPSTMNDPAAWEFFAGNDAGGAPLWTSSLAAAKPIIDWNNRVGNVSMTWDPAIGRYLMFVTDGWPTTDTMDTYLLESTSLTGPFRLVQWWEDFGPQGYFFNIPSKFVSGDGLSFWTLYSANFTWGSDNWIGNPDISGYHACFLETRLRTPAHGTVNGVPATPPATGPGSGTGTGTGTTGAGSSSGGNNSNGDHQINDKCFAAAAVPPPWGLLLAFLALGANVRIRFRR